MNRRQRRAAKAYIAAESAKLPERLAEIPRDQWPSDGPPGLLRVWRSRGFLVQLYSDKGYERLTVNRACLKGKGWGDEITWQELQDLKRQAGFGDVDAVEVFPRDCDVVNVANMRHLWLMPYPVAFAWRNA
jgi:hypothetical protein